MKRTQLEMLIEAKKQYRAVYLRSITTRLEKECEMSATSLNIPAWITIVEKYEQALKEDIPKRDKQLLESIGERK